PPQLTTRRRQMKFDKRLALTLSLTAIVALTAITLALAHGGPGGGPGGFHSPGAEVRPPRAGHPVGLLRQLIYPCQAACSSTAKDCNEAADSAALSCASAACPAEIQAAQTACATDSRSDACLAAVSDLRDCAGDCLDTRTTALMTCRSALTDC